jgi:DhnA family fructose-bisphosphate aldolase class Ia
LILNLTKLFGASGKAVVLATDHRYFGVVNGLENPAEVITPLLPYVDVLMTEPHILRNVYGGKVDKPVMLRASGCSSVMNVSVPGYLQEPAKAAYQQRTGRPFDKAVAELTASVKSGKATEAEQEELRYLESFLYEPDTIGNEKLILTGQGCVDEGAAGAAVSVYLRTHYQTSTLDNLATMSRQARPLGLPVLGVVAVGTALGYLEQDIDFLTRASAVMVAHGADIIKTYNCGNGFDKVIEATGVPVIVAGGKVPKGKDPTIDTLDLAYDCMQKGASGLDFGRRIWRHDHPVAVARALGAIVHKNATPKEALQLFEEVSNQQPA